MNMEIAADRVRFWWFGYVGVAFALGASACRDGRMTAGKSEAIESWASLLREIPTSREAVEGLRVSYPDSEHSLQVLLSDRDSRVRRAAAHVVETLGSVAPEFLLTMYRLLRDPNEDVRNVAGRYFWVFGELPQEFVMEVLGDLRTGDTTIRRTALLALHPRSAPDARFCLQVVPGVTAALRDSVVATRVLAAQLLAKCGPYADRAASQLAAVVLHDESRRVQVEAAIALAEIGPSASETEAQLISVLQGLSPSDMFPIAYALARIDPDGTPGASLLLELLADSRVTPDALHVLNSVVAREETVSTAIPLLVRACTCPGLEVQAVHALTSLGSLAEPAVPALCALAVDAGADPVVRTLAITALGQVAPTSAESLRVFGSALTSADGAMRRAASTSLLAAGDFALDVLFGALSSGATDVREEAVITLGLLALQSDSEQRGRIRGMLRMRLRVETDEGVTLQARIAWERAVAKPGARD